MRFFKLDTGVIRGFDAALSPEVQVFRTGLGAILLTLFKLGPWKMALAIVRALFGRTGADVSLIQGNLTRKRIRLPSVFGYPVILNLYAAIKMFDAGLLIQALEQTLEQTSPKTVIIYNGSNYPESVLAHVAERAGMPRVYVESGFFPGTLQIDPKGLNGANSVPRDPEFYLKNTEDFAALGWPDSVNNRASKKVGQGEISLPAEYVFVPFQVPSDMQVTLHSPWVQDMVAFLDVIRDAADRNPNETFVIKEHPSFKISVKGLREPHPRVIFANDNVTSDLIEGARAVITLNSTVGIEGLMLDKPVITLGEACYNIEGLVCHAPDEQTLDRALMQTRLNPVNDALRRQVIGYIYNRYLTHGRYDAPPADLADRIEKIAHHGIS